MDERERLAENVRRLIEYAATSEAEPATVAAAADAVGRIADELEPHVPADPPSNTPLRFDGADPQRIFPFSPIIGPDNPLAVPVRVSLDGRDVTGEVTFPSAYEGPPGCVHGGVIAETFDEMLGVANLASGTAGMTGTLTVRYRKPTPLRAPLRIEARTDRVEGRKVFASARMYAGDTLTAEADGIFISVGLARFGTHGF
jgi:acyl-coenzyme A thioesterase PaaI-like protein